MHMHTHMHMSMYYRYSRSLTCYLLSEVSLLVNLAVGAWTVEGWPAAQAPPEARYFAIGLWRRILLGA